MTVFEHASRLWAKAEGQARRRARRWPRDEHALAVIHDAQQRLRELGWNDAIYCPKDGTVFEALQLGSQAIFDCMYVGDWPNGAWFVVDDDDMWPANPALFRLKQGA